ncbi:hypothetical protein [Aureispira sp. CCB-QB1]|uniref:hypothetical protein n=1 Tax=Aureispira sp. CCB-QB1 TaxID=1313421 RepID=UPI00069768C0|nr:hypothetical protein [Aureispira sp. CCB-QB1]
MSDYPQKVTYKNSTKKLTLHFKDASKNTELLLSEGLELTIYKHKNTGILQGELSIANSNDFDNAPVYSKILFNTIDYDGDIKGGFADATTQLKLKDLDSPYIDIANSNKFMLGIIGVDDIRALTSEPKFNQIYLMQKQRIFLKTTTNSNNETTIEIKYMKRT